MFSLYNNGEHAVMARTKSFDPEQALESALQLFWTNGYEQTSMQDLVEAMGINRGSLYDTFGDKRQLYSKTIERYLDCYTLKDIRAVMAENEYSPREQLRLLFDRLVEEGAGINRKRGCLLTNTITELAHRDPEITQQAKEGIRHAEEILTKLVRQGQALGQFNTAEDARALARFLVNSIQGIRVLSRIYGEREPLADIARIALDTMSARPVTH